MKTLKIFLSALAVMAFMTACSSEDAPEPLFHSPADFFRPAENDNSPTAELRRDFFAKYGSYLLFNDTIQKKYLGKDINGEDVYNVETLDLAYSIGLSNLSWDSYKFTYLLDFESQKKMIDYLDEYILYHFQGKIKPFTYFVCDKIEKHFNTMGTTAYPYASSGQRGVAIAGNYLLIRERSEKQKAAYSERVLGVMMGQLAVNFAEDFEEFYQFSTGYYGVDWANYGSNKNQTLCKLGFLSIGELTTKTPNQSEDLSQYAVATLQYTDEQFSLKYGDYPLMVQKFLCIKDLFRSLGFVYEKNVE